VPKRPGHHPEVAERLPLVERHVVLINKYGRRATTESARPRVWPAARTTPLRMAGRRALVTIRGATFGFQAPTRRRGSRCTAAGAIRSTQNEPTNPVPTEAPHNRPDHQPGAARRKFLTRHITLQGKRVGTIQKRVKT
jgi:hypothetical protein